MRTPSAAFLTAIENARENGLIVRRSMTIWPANRDTGVATMFGLWTGDDEIQQVVKDGENGGTDDRLFYGGVNLSIPTIPRVTGLSVYSFKVSMSQIADAVQTIFRTYDPRLAKVEIHEWILAPSGLPVSDPESVFLGRVSDSDVQTPAVGGTGAYSVTVESDSMRMLTRKNPATRSDEFQKRRSGDRFSKYTNTSALTEVYWGENKPPTLNGGGGGGGLDRTGKK
jgi:hypothetical protein